jgi:ubiquinone/menaquinone biosynthesis C-methylase UbiE
MIAEFLHRKRMKIIKKYCDYVNLDIGAGKFPKGKFSLDVNKRFHPDIIADAHNIPIRNNSIDSIVCSHVIEHSPDANLVLSEIKRILKRGGRVIFFLPDDDSFYWRLIKPFWSFYYMIAVSPSDCPLAHKQYFNPFKLMRYLRKYFRNVFLRKFNFGMEIFVVCMK